MPGPTKVVLRDLSLTLNAGQVIYQWNGPKWDYVEDAPVALGLLKSVTLDKKMLQQIAGNEDIFGDLGGIPETPSVDHSHYLILAELGIFKVVRGIS